MNATYYRTWRFVHPNAPSADAHPGLQVSPQGNIELLEGLAAIRQAVMLLLSTVPGERVMRQDYGCDLHRLVFSPNDDTTAGLAIHYVRRALQRWEPRIEILQLDAGADPERAEVLAISVRYRVRALAQVDELTVSLDLQEGEG